MYSYTFRKGSVVVTEGVSGSVLTINPVVRGDEGMYACEVNNTVGMATITGNVLVVGELMCKLTIRREQIDAYVD